MGAYWRPETHQGQKVVTEVKGLQLPCPKCGRLLFQLSYTGILLAPLAGLLVLCAPCSVMVSVTAAFPNLFHAATEAELLPTTVPYQVLTEQKE